MSQTFELTGSLASQHCVGYRQTKTDLAPTRPNSERNIMSLKLGVLTWGSVLGSINSGLRSVNPHSSSIPRPPPPPPPSFSLQQHVPAYRPLHLDRSTRQEVPNCALSRFGIHHRHFDHLQLCGLLSSLHCSQGSSRRHRSQRHQELVYVLCIDVDSRRHGEGHF